MHDRNSRQSGFDGLCAEHVFPRPSDRHPVFMFGTFRTLKTRSAAAQAPRKSNFRLPTIDGSALAARRAGWSADDTMPVEAEAFMFGVHTE